jgi:DNA adenine methylase
MPMTELKNEQVKPFLRWAGGKRWLFKHLDTLLPGKINNYHEPFLGSGSVFFYLKSKGIIDKAFLSDTNADLINSFRIVKSNATNLLSELDKFSNDEETYYQIRDRKYKDQLLSAAKFIYLNRTSFNGIYRVNQQGNYNVPYGFKSYETLFDHSNFINTSNLLKRAFLSVSDFDKRINKINEGDLVFIDPPYTVAHENNGFLKYNQKIFSWEDQKRLLQFLNKIAEKKAHYIMTNASHQSILLLFKNSSNILKLNRPSTIGGKGANRQNYNELIFTNF